MNKFSFELRYFCSNFAQIRWHGIMRVPCFCTHLFNIKTD